VNVASLALGTHAVTRAFQWAFFPVTLVAGLGAMAFVLEHGLSADAAAVGIPLVVFALIAIFERVLPWNPDWNRSRGDVGADVASLGIVALGVESVLKVAGPAAAVLVVARFSSFSLPAGARLFARHLPFWAQCALVVGFIELVKYWFHRLGHESPFWWPLHSVHHAVKRVYVLNGFRIHPLYHGMTYLLGYFPCILLGAPVETLLVHNVILGICGAFQHCNIDLKYGPLNYVFSTNEIHRWHHSTLKREGNRNYGACLSIFDVVFGTYFNAPGRSPEVIGMFAEEGYPMNSYWRQLAVPFMYRRWVKPGASGEEST
jgi:sterol desaturase/sphingolipid hydroxylase (fatty acid hydroxylase superfamily)